MAILGALGFGRFGYTMILPAMKDGLGLTDAQTGDIAGANMLGYLLLSVASGFAASRFSPRLVATVALFFVAASMFATGLARSFPAVVALRFLAGAGSGGVNVPVMGLLAAWFVTRRRGIATGIAVSGSSLGILITGVLLPRVMLRFGEAGWRASWQILGAAAAVICAVCGFLLRDDPRDKQLLAVGSDQGAEPRGTNAKLRWHLVYRSRSMWSLSLIYVMFGLSYVIYATFFAEALVSEGGFTQKSAGALWSAVGGLSIASGFVWGGVSDRLGRRETLALICVLQGASYAVFGLWRATPGYYVSAGLFAVTAWSVPAVISAAAADAVGARLAPAAIGFMTVFFGVGQTIGPMAAGRIADATGSFSGAFLLAAAAAFAGAAMSAAGRFRHPRPTEPTPD
jgi:MFS family permease